MGDPKKQKKKYETPSHPWKRERIEKEKILLKDYGLKNKGEVWRAESRLRRLTSQAKKLISSKTEHAKKEEKQLLTKLLKYNLTSKDAKVEDVLNLTINNILDRRLQTIVSKKGMAKTSKQARQFIIHHHITVNDKLVTVPSYFVRADEEDKLGFRQTSNLAKPDHPEMLKAEQKIKKSVKIKEVKKPAEETTEVIATNIKEN